MNTDHDRIPWQMLLKTGLSFPGLTTESFWKMSVREFLLLSEALGQAHGRAGAPDRTTLSELLDRYPD